MKSHSRKRGASGQHTPNDYRIEGKFAFLALSQAKETKIDLADLPKALARRWHAAKGRTSTFYAASSWPRPFTFLHRFLTDPPDHLVVDHDDGDGLNNTRKNLIHKTLGENGRNKRPWQRRTYKGVPLLGFKNPLHE